MGPYRRQTLGVSLERKEGTWDRNCSQGRWRSPRCGTGGRALGAGGTLLSWGSPALQRSYYFT